MAHFKKTFLNTKLSTSHRLEIVLEGVGQRGKATLDSYFVVGSDFVVATSLNVFGN